MEHLGPKDGKLVTRQSIGSSRRFVFVAKPRCCPVIGGCQTLWRRASQMRSLYRLVCLLALTSTLTSNIGPVSSVIYKDITESSGVTFRHQGSPTENKFLIETMGGGVALLDFDSDGLLDIFFVNGCPLKGATSIAAISGSKTGE